MLQAGRAPTMVRRMSVAPSAPPALHPLEAEVMEQAWESGEVSVRAVMDALNRTAPKARADTTYLPILRGSPAKGLLARRREGNTDYFRPVHTRPQYADLRARAEV